MNGLRILVFSPRTQASADTDSTAFCTISSRLLHFLAQPVPNQDAQAIIGMQPEGWDG